jgi:hypothetical protein
MKGKHRETREGVWLYGAAGGLMLGGPLWQYLYLHRYPFDQLEAVALPVAACLVGAGVATAARWLGGSAGGVIFGALLFVFADLQFNLEKEFRTRWIAVACLALPLVFRSKRASLATVTLGAFYLASLPRSAPPPPVTIDGPLARPAPSVPLLVHVVLDEQWGIGGLRAAGDSATAEFLSEFYLQRGFEVYEAAYSRWQWTVESIPNLISLGQRAETERSGRRGGHVRLLRNPYFERLRRLGYEIHVYQSSFVDYCRSIGAAVASCEEAAGNSIANIGYLHADWTLRAALAARYFLNKQSRLYRRYWSRDGETWSSSFAGRGLGELRRIRDALGAGPEPGTAMFAHLLLPHRPLEVGSDCRPYWRRPPIGPWVVRGKAAPPQVSTPAGGTRSDSAAARSDPKWRSRLALYGGQVRCVHREMAELLGAIDSTVGRDGAIVIVHGDHGSRMRPDPGSGARRSELRRRRLNAAHSTLLAIRRPRVPAALYSDPVPVQDFLRELVRNDFEGEVRTEWVHYVRATPLRPSSKAPGAVQRLRPQDMPWVRPVN